MKLLIVDDSRLMRQSIEVWLDSNHIEVIGSAGDGEEAVELFEKHKPDLVTLDITMPKLDGLAALEAMKKIKPDAIIIIISAISDKEIALQAMEKGAATFVNKPFTQEDLIEALDEVTT